MLLHVILLFFTIFVCWTCPYAVYAYWCVAINTELVIWIFVIKDLNFSHGHIVQFQKSIKEVVKIYYRIYSTTYVNRDTEERLVWLPDCLMLDFIAFPVIITSRVPSQQLSIYNMTVYNTKLYTSRMVYKMY